MSDPNDSGLPLADLLPDFRRHLLAKNRSERTIYLYLTSAERLMAWLSRAERPATVRTIDRRTLERFFAELPEQLGPATVSMQYRNLVALWTWLLDEDEVDANPFEKMREPNATPTTATSVSSATPIRFRRCAS